MKRLRTTVAISGGGPAGMMLGLLLARSGIEVVVLEKHADFFRDFRGDTIHPSTLDLIDQLGLREAFAHIPQTRIRTLDAVVKGIRITPVDFSLLPASGNQEGSLMPQWDFLTLLADTAERLPTFTLLMDAEATGLTVTPEGTVTGLRASTAEGPIEISADLTVAADGRTSRLRDAAGLGVVKTGVPIDVLWFRLPRPEVVTPDTIAYIADARMVITIPRTDYFQVGMVIAKGAFADLRERGLDAFRADLVDTVPFLEPVVGTLADWDEVKLLTVEINHLTRWHVPGFLAIGDAAHAMSPAFGVGVNYAIQDAVATANLLVAPLRAGTLTDADLARVEARRAAPTYRMQALQARLHRTVARPGGGATIPSGERLSRLLRVTVPVLRRFAVRLIGRGFRPERIETEPADPVSR